MSVIATCPSWCTTNHLGADKPIEHAGPRWPTVHGVSGKSWANVGICTDREHGVVVQLDADYGPNLTPQRAREVAKHLLEAATWVVDHHDDRPQHGTALPARRRRGAFVRLGQGLGVPNCRESVTEGLGRGDGWGW